MNEQLNNMQFCKDCGAKINVKAEICPECGIRQQLMRSNTKSPGLAAVLSFFFTGLGQIYNGQIIKGLLLIIIQFINILLMFILIGFLTYPLVWIFGMIDAYNAAEKINAEQR